MKGIYKMNKRELELLHAAKLLVGQILDTAKELRTDEGRDLRTIYRLMKWHTDNSQAKETLRNTVVEVAVESIPKKITFPRLEPFTGPMTEGSEKSLGAKLPSRHIPVGIYGYCPACREIAKNEV